MTKKYLSIFVAIIVAMAPVMSFAEVMQDENGDNQEMTVVEQETEDTAVNEEPENPSGNMDQEEPGEGEEPSVEPEEPDDPVIEKKTTKITGKKLKITARARGKVTDKVTVENAGAREVRLQWKNPETGKWSTLKSFNTTDAEKQEINIIYPSKWWYTEKTTWRMYVKGNDDYSKYISDEIVITSKRYYQNPSKYLQINDEIRLSKTGGYTLKKGYMGLKVQKVNQYFGIGDSNWPRYTSTTRSCVKSFQRNHGLKVTGNVNKATWLKMGKVRKSRKGSAGYFTSKNWYRLGAYVYPMKIDRTYSRKQCVNRFIKTAYQYKGKPYVVGAAGSPKEGADCSGLVMQCMYSCGINPEPVSCVRHSKPGYEYESRNLYKTKKLKHISWKNRKRGDLIFYKNYYGTIIHVGIYLGNNKIIHSWPDKVRVSSVYGWGNIAGVRRVFD